METGNTYYIWTFNGSFEKVNDEKSYRNYLKKMYLKNSTALLVIKEENKENKENIKNIKKIKT